jgi:hypothetical protein
MAVNQEQKPTRLQNKQSQVARLVIQFVAHGLGQGWPTPTHRRATECGRTRRRSHYTYTNIRWGDWSNSSPVIYKNIFIAICHIMFYRPIILGSLNCITETIQVNDTCKYFPQGPHVDQPWLRESSARFIHSDDWVRLIFTAQHLSLFIRVMLRQGTVKTLYQ